MNDLKKKIPQHNPYCYEIKGYPPHENLQDIVVNGITVDYCPYYNILSIKGVTIPFCFYLKQGGIGQSNTDEDIAKLCRHFDCTEDELDELFPLDLLWDACKACGESDGINEIDDVVL
jgi:hypothetical protein